MHLVIMGGAVCLALSLPALAIAGAVNTIASRFERHH